MHYLTLSQFKIGWTGLFFFSRSDFPKCSPLDQEWKNKIWHMKQYVFKVIVVWKQGGAQGCEPLRGLDSVLWTGVWSHHSVWFEVRTQLSHRYADARLPKIWMQALQAMILRGISELHPVNSTLSLDSEKHLTASLAWNVHSAFLDWTHAAKTTSPAAELQVPLNGNTAALHSTTIQQCRAEREEEYPT